MLVFVSPGVRSLILFYPRSTVTRALSPPVVIQRVEADVLKGVAYRKDILLASEAVSYCFFFFSVDILIGRRSVEGCVPVNAFCAALEAFGFAFRKALAPSAVYNPDVADSLS